MMKDLTMHPTPLNRKMSLRMSRVFKAQKIQTNVKRKQRKVRSWKIDLKDWLDAKEKEENRFKPGDKVMIDTEEPRQPNVIGNANEVELA